MLADFFIRIGLVKRAESKLNRFFAMFLHKSEAKTLLDSLRKNS